MAKFKEGDKVKITGNSRIEHFFKIGDIVTIKKIYSTDCLLDRGDKTQTVSYCDFEKLVESKEEYTGATFQVGDKVLIIKTKNTIMDKIKEIPSTLKRILNGNLKKQYKAGFLNTDLSLTELGKSVLIEIQQVEHEEELAKRAEEILLSEGKNK